LVFLQELKKEISSRAGPGIIFTKTIPGVLHSFASHANIDFRLGFLNYVFSMTELHRMHHSRQIRECDSNYGGTTIIWDILFNSRIQPACLAENQVGL